jgi:hypothetical protein
MSYTHCIAGASRAKLERIAQRVEEAGMPISAAHDRCATDRSASGGEGASAHPASTTKPKCAVQIILRICQASQQHLMSAMGRKRTLRRYGIGATLYW